MSAELQRRVRQVRFRAATRRWEYRQRNHAKGTWYRLRRVLADAAEAYEIDASDAARLVAEGVEPDPCGDALEPARQIFFVSPERAAALATARKLAVRLDAALLSAEHLALTRF